MTIKELSDLDSLQNSITVSGTAELLIEPSKGWVSLKLRDLWEYRELLYFLTWRNIKVRYKQTVLGFARPAIRPVFCMGALMVIFGILDQVPSDGVSYPI